MNILYFLIKTEGEEFSELTKKSIEKNLTKDDLIEYFSISKEEEAKQLYYKMVSTIDKKKLKKINYICLLNNNSVLEDNYRTILEEYVDIENTTNKVYLPISLLISSDSIRGTLNSSLWSFQTLEPGLLDHNLSLQQTDTVLFGSLISKELILNEQFYNLDLKYYQHYYILNTISYNESNEIRGIPKLLVNIDYDLSYTSVSKEEKIKYYKMAREIKLLV